jgi:putative DNA primase/helicase
MNDPVSAALAYAERGWPVCPWASAGDRKYPLTTHGHLDATTDAEAIQAWWRRWPLALPAIATGERSGVVALDIDVRPDGSGFDTLEAMDVAAHAETPTTHTPRRGCAVLFRWPGHFVKTIAGRLGLEYLDLEPDKQKRGSHLDIRGDGGSLILPPGPGRTWDPYLGPDTPLADMPAWMLIPEPAAPAAPVLRDEPPPRPQQISRYAEVALDRAVAAIVAAPAGQQHDTLNREIYSIARLVAGGTIPAGLAVDSLRWAARQIRSHDQRRPWKPLDLDKAVRSAFADGLARPRYVSERAA